ncbi:MAG: histidine kinase dimerization/phospho-acceptor domain-containing protein [candidate division Zixibacteria bacterium]|nr:histidine kinase dimerization/phospho-acceptor domain-containing protein [candidate division Zixibacteria bacterium]
MRILVLENNRYHSLLMERELSKRYPEWVVSFFTSANAALEELTLAHYDVCVASISLLGNRLDTMVDVVSAYNGSTQSLIFLSTCTEESKRVAHIHNSHSLMKNEFFYLRLPNIIDMILVKLQGEATHNEFAEARVTPGVVVIPVGKNALAHEMNNPLMAILGMAELLASPQYHLSPSVEKKTSSIYHSALRIQSSVERLIVMNEGALQPPTSSTIGPASPLKRTSRLRKSEPLKIIS